MKHGISLLIIDFIWIIGFLVITSITLVPIYIIIAFIVEHVKLGLVYSIIIPILILITINIYIIVVGLLFRLCVPRLKSGHYKTNSKQFFYWRLNWHFYSYVFLFFHKYLFYNRTIRYIFLRLLRVDIKYSTYFAETVDLQDANNLIHIGNNSGLGSEVLIASHLLLGNDIIIFKEINIGSNCLIEARAAIAPGTIIYDNVIIGAGCNISIDVTIYSGTRVGALTIIHAGSIIGKNCRIGFSVNIPPKSIIADNTKIPDFAIWYNKCLVE